MYKKYASALALFLMLFNTIYAQNGTQTIRGTIVDKQSQSPIIGALVTILGTNPLKGATTNETGKFKIVDVAPGRYDLKINYIGYKEIIMANLEVTSGKEIVLEIGMEENTTDIKEVVISGTKKNETNNELTTVSGRQFSVEEVNRYAGGRSDPARLAANFAGVSSPDDSRNDIVIRGNSPKGVLWRIEGLNVPNPNHFSTIGTTGGPVSAINTNVLKNSDFFTSAFPAEYSNANAGVFDLGFRTGNSEKREHTFQLGALTGIEAMTEGPINKKKGSSYLLAYRYSFTGVAQAIGLNIGTTATPFYQDLSFKINGGTTKFGKFTLFGIGAASNIDFSHKKTEATDLFADPTRDSYFKSKFNILGVKHFIKVNSKSYFNTVIGGTYTKTNYIQDKIVGTIAEPEIDLKSIESHYSIRTSFNSKINARLFIKIGAATELINLVLDAQSRNVDANGPWNKYWDYNDYTMLHQFYAQAKYNINSRLILNAGINSQLLALNKSSSIEPRVGLKFQVNDKSSFSAGFGMHSQMQSMDVYFYRKNNGDGTYNMSNKDLGFTRSKHFVIGYDVLPLKDWRIKTELYYQLLTDIPVSISPNSFSMLNTGSSFIANSETNLKNTGTGTNYGAELTVEKFFSHGYYFLLTGSLYESKYKGSDNIERNSSFNGKYVYNFLAGKDFKIGTDNRKVISIGIKVTQAGGRYYTPVDLVASQIAKEQILKGDNYAFTERNPDFFRMDFKVGYTQNSKKRKLSQSWSFDVNNMTNNKNVFAERYNPVTNQINTSYQIGFFPNFVYKIQF